LKIRPTNEKLEQIEEQKSKLETENFALENLLS